MAPGQAGGYLQVMKYRVHWKGPAAGDPVDSDLCSLANAIELAGDQRQRGRFLYLTDETGKRLTLEAAERLKGSASAQQF